MNTRSPKTARARFLQRLHLAHAHVHAELIAFADNCFSVAGPGFHGPGHNIGSKRFKIENGFVGGDELNWA